MIRFFMAKDEDFLTEKGIVGFFETLNQPEKKEVAILVIETLRFSPEIDNDHFQATIMPLAMSITNDMIGSAKNLYDSWIEYMLYTANRFDKNYVIRVYFEIITKEQEMFYLKNPDQVSDNDLKIALDLVWKNEPIEISE